MYMTNFLLLCSLDYKVIDVTILMSVTIFTIFMYSDSYTNFVVNVATYSDVHWQSNSIIFFTVFLCIMYVSVVLLYCIVHNVTPRHTVHSYFVVLYFLYGIS